MVYLVRLIAFNLIIVFSGFAYAGNLSGTWEGQDYNIELSNSFNNIEGDWGDVNFDLDVSKSFQSIEGSIASEKVDLSFSSSFKSVEGEMPCGKIDYDYSLSFNYVEGSFCGQNFKINLEHEADVIPTAQDIILYEILDYFPRPSRGAVRRFVLSRIKF